MPPDLRLLVNGREYGGWKSARVTRGIESISGSFDLQVSDRWAGQDASWPIVEEDACTLELCGETVILGYVDRRSLSCAAGEHTFEVSGRDKTAALVDCSAVLSKWEFRGVPLLTLAQRLAEPLGITVSVQSGLTIPRLPQKVTVDPGDTAFDALERACRMVGVLPVSDGQGGLLLTRTGSARTSTALVEGENILAASADYDATGRFAKYIVTGQRQGTDADYGLGAAAVRGEARDASVRRAHRVLMVRAESGITPAHAKQRAQWEAKVRAGRGDSVSITVQGWQQRDGSLWPVNAKVPVRSPLLGIDGEMLITQLTYSLDDSQGTVTHLSLKRPDAFLPEPVVPKSGIWKEIAPGV